MSVPWETIIKIYRSKLGKRKFDTLKEYAENFNAFLDNGNLLFPDDIQKEYFSSAIYSYFYHLIRKDIKNEVKSILSENLDITHEKVKQITSNLSIE